MNATHDPNPEFLSHLEWQVRSALRREERFSRPARHSNGGTMKIASLILFSALLGAGGVVVKEEVQEARAQEVIVARLLGEIRLASMELELAGTQFDEVHRRYQAGVLGEEDLLSARMVVSQAETSLARLQLDLDEVRSSGREPRNELSAPLVGGRDFVTERLALQESVASQRTELARSRFARVQELVDAGIVHSIESAQTLLAVTESEAQEEEIRGRMDARRRFLDGSLTGAEADAEAELSVTRIQVEVTRQALDEAHLRYQQLEDRVELGVVRDTELQLARLDIMRLETRLEFLEVKRLTLDRKEDLR